MEKPKRSKSKARKQKEKRSSGEIAGSRDIKTLLEQNAELIAAIRAQCAEQLEEQHDDIFLLRYALSYKDAAKASAHVLAGLEYRKNNPWLEYAKDHDYKWEVDAKVMAWTVADHHKTKIDGGPVQYIRAGLSDPNGLMKAVTPEELCQHMTKKKEEAFLVLDEVTRRTGRLTKMMVIFDMKNQGFTIPGQDLIDSMNKSSEVAQHLYPQLLERVVIINAPWFMQQVFKIAKMVLSERLTGKAGMCTGTIEPNELSACPFASKVLRPEDVPTFAGGSCKCPGGCVGDVPNDSYEIKKPDGAEAAKKGWFW